MRSATVALSVRQYSRCFALRRTRCQVHPRRAIKGRKTLPSAHAGKPRPALAARRAGSRAESSVRTFKMDPASLVPVQDVAALSRCPHPALTYGLFRWTLPFVVSAAVVVGMRQRAAMAQRVAPACLATGSRAAQPLIISGCSTVTDIMHVCNKQCAV
eukprot:IDg17339t1